MPQQWHKAFGYSPVLAETFTDIELFEGTCYKAAGWMPGGQTKGYSRHRADFYHFHGRPKKLWLKPLGGLSAEQVRALLYGPLPQVCRRGAKPSASGVLPIPESEAYSIETPLALPLRLRQRLARLCQGRLDGGGLCEIRLDTQGFFKMPDRLR